jgi:predicted permease
MYLTYAEENRAFESIGLWTPGVATITGNGDPEEVPRVAVTLGVLEALGVPPLLGRWFGADDRGGGAGRTVMLSHGYWQRRFGGDPAVIGRTLTVNSEPAEIIGVMPEGFRIRDTDADLLMGPMRFDRSQAMLVPFAYFSIARLKPGMTIADANADLARMIPLWLESWPAPPGADKRVYADVWRIGAAARPLKDDVLGPIGELLWFVMATIGVVLTIACANVANLMLIRGEARQHELAIRAALGAGAGRLARVLLLEGLLIGLVGGVAGLVLADAGVRLLLAFGPANLPRLAEVALDAKVVAAALVVSSVAGLIVGVGPAARLVKAGIQSRLHGGRTVSEGASRRRIRQSLLTGQIALSAVVLVCAGLLLRAVEAIRTVDPGFTGAEQVQTLRISIRDTQIREPQRVARRQQEIVEALAALPGVGAVGFASSLPMDEFNRLGNGIEVEGRPPDPGGVADVRRFKYVSPRLFDAAGIALLAGRDLTWADLYEGHSVVLLSANMARELWATPTAAIGKRIRIVDDARWHEVVGVVADVHEDGLREAAPSIVYWPSLNGDFSVSRSVIFAARTPHAGTEAVSRQVQEAVWSVDASLPVTWVRTLRDIYDQHLSRTTFTLGTLLVAAAASLALSVVGLYGVLSYAVSLRRREIAIRLALGAQQREIRGRFVRHGVVLAALGAGAGLVAAAGVTRLMASLLYEVEPVDPLTYAAVAVALVAVAALASYVPARRASAVDPAESLAAE